MLPRILLALFTAAIYKFKSTCSVCESKLTWNQDCLFDFEPVCENCGVAVEASEYGGYVISKGGRCCKIHLSKYEILLNQRRADIDQQKINEAKMKWAREESINVKTWSKNYKGDVPVPKLNRHIVTGKFKDKDESLTQLKMLAVLDGCFAIQQVEQIKSTGEEGNFKFAEWQATGII